MNIYINITCFIIGASIGFYVAHNSRQLDIQDRHLEALRRQTDKINNRTPYKVRDGVILDWTGVSSDTVLPKQGKHIYGQHNLGYIYIATNLEMAKRTNNVSHKEWVCDDIIN